MLLPFMSLRYTKEVFFIMAFVAISGYVWYNGYNKGHTVASLACKEAMDEYRGVIKDKIDNIEQNSRSLLEQNTKLRDEFKEDVANILLTVKNKPAYIIQDGKCKPSKEYVNAVNAAVERANR